MEIIEIKKTALVLDKTETSRLVECLKYCQHRLIHHEDSGIHKSKATADFVDYMIKNLARKE